MSENPWANGANWANSVVDAGLATERTFLAWQRTAIGLVAASGLATKYVAPAVGGNGPMFIGVLGIILGIGALIWFRLRYRTDHRNQTETGTLGGRGAGPLILVATSAFLLAVMVALLAVVSWN